jgi:hypothetical protein
MADHKLQKLETELTDYIRKFIENHPIYRCLKEVEKRNMAYSGSAAALGALTHNALEEVDTQYGSEPYAGLPLHLHPTTNI